MIPSHGRTGPKADRMAAPAPHQPSKPNTVERELSACLLAVVLLMSLTACKGEKETKASTGFKNGHIKTHCVGRYVISIPDSFSPSAVTTGVFKATGLSAQDPAFEIIVRAGGFTPSQFSSQVRKRRNEIKQNEDETTDVLRAETTLNDGATLFRVQRIDDAYISEINFLRGANLITASLKSYGNRFLAAEEDLIKFANGIKENDTKIENLKEHGFCLGPVVVTGQFKEEKSAHFLFRDGKGNDFGIEINTYQSGLAEPLLSRMSEPNSLLTIFDVKHKVLRARERIVAGMRAQEWLARANLEEQRDAKTFKFALETMPQPEKNSPGITLSFDSAQPLEDGTSTRTTMPDEEAIQLWDAVVQSVRPATS
jgi:Tle cognate immunity protein 4 C-terminal domain